MQRRTDIGIMRRPSIAVLALAISLSASTAFAGGCGCDGTGPCEEQTLANVQEDALNEGISMSFGICADCGSADLAGTAIIGALLGLLTLPLVLRPIRWVVLSPEIVRAPAGSRQ
jgi:hypothetical protein